MLNNVVKLEKDLQISRIQLIREELEMQVLYSLSRQIWSKQLAFYGGTALRLAYDAPRFSEDIDMFWLEDGDYKAFSAWVRKLGKDLSYPVTIQDLHQKRKTFFALLTIAHPDSKHAIPLKLEFFRNQAQYPAPETELRLIKSPVSPLSPLLQVATLSALKKMKLEALEDRSKPRDLYDLWYIDQLLRQPFELPKKLPTYQYRSFINELQVYLPKNQFPVIQYLWTTYESARKKT